MVVASESPTVRRGPASSSSVRLVHELAELAEVFEPSVNLIALRRAMSPALVEDAQCVLAQGGFRRSFSVAATAGGSDIASELAGFPHLAADVQHWVQVLADLTGASTVGVRLARLQSAMCPRFHVDHVLVRVVSTYAGSGTEFLSSDDVDRRYLGRGSRGMDDETSGLLLPGCRVQRAQQGDVVLLKGEAWPDNTGNGVVHRSPWVGDSARLVLTLDPL